MTRIPIYAFFTFLTICNTLPVRCFGTPTNEEASLSLNLEHISRNASTNRPSFRLTLTNTSNRDFAIFFGYMSPHRQYPKTITLTFTSDAGKKYTLADDDGKAVGMIGKPPTPMILPLASRATHSIAIDFDHFWFRPLHEFHRTGLPAGKYKVQAVLTPMTQLWRAQGLPEDRFSTIDTLEMSARSNVLTLEVE